MAANNNIIKQENIGGGGDNMSILRSDLNADVGDELAGKCFVEDDRNNDYVLVPADAVTTISGGQGGDNDEQTSNNLSLLAVNNESSLAAEVRENIDDQHQEVLSNKPADVIKDGVTSTITTVTAEQPSSQNDQSSSQASSATTGQMTEESGNVESPAALPAEDSILHQGEAFSQHSTEDSSTAEMVRQDLQNSLQQNNQSLDAQDQHSTEDSSATEMVRQDLQNSLQQNNQSFGAQEAIITPSLIESPVAPNHVILHTTSLPSFSPLKAPKQPAEVQVSSHQPLNNQSSQGDSQGDSNLNPLATDPTSFCQEKLAPCSSLSSFQGVSHQSAPSSLPGTNSFHQAAGVNAGLTMPSGLPANFAGNMVYAAVPLQQPTGMQMAHLQPRGNAYNLARPKAAARRALLPRGRSASEPTKVSSFKGKITPLTYDKPNVGLVQQIMEVFHAAGKREMQPCEVYDGLQCCYPYYLHLNPNRKKSWMSSVRHALTTPCFMSRRSDDSDGKLASRKGSFWSINTSYNPDEKPPKRSTPNKRQVGNSPTYHRRPLGIDAEQANWRPFRRPHNRSARHNPYGYFSPTRGSFSPAEPSNSIPMMYSSPPNVYRQQTPTAALLPNGKMIYLSPADETVGHQNQREMYHSWSADSSSPNLWQVVQNMGNENCMDQQNRAIYSIANQQPQGSMSFTAHPTAATNVNCNNATTTTQSLGTKTTIRQQKQLNQQELLQQQLLQQHFQQQQQLIQQQQQQQQISQQQASLVTDPFAAAMELSDIKSSMESEENDPTTTCEAAWKVATEQSEGKPQQDMGTTNSSTTQQCTVEVPISTAEQFMGFANTQNTQPLTPTGTVSAPAQQGCDDLRTMVYQSLGVCNVQGSRPEGILTSSTNVGSNPSVTQLSTMPTTQYQLLHYSNTSQQY